MKILWNTGLLIVMYVEGVTVVDIYGDTVATYLPQYLRRAFPLALLEVSAGLI